MKIGFFGFARPAFGAIPPTTEMQARLWAMVLNEDVTLPSQEEMVKVISFSLNQVGTLWT